MVYAGAKFGPMSTISPYRSNWGWAPQGSRGAMTTIQGNKMCVMYFFGGGKEKNRKSVAPHGSRGLLPVAGVGRAGYDKILLTVLVHR